MLSALGAELKRGSDTLLSIHPHQTCSPWKIEVILSCKCIVPLATLASEAASRLCYLGTQSGHIPGACVHSSFELWDDGVMHHWLMCLADIYGMFQVMVSCMSHQ